MPKHADAVLGKAIQSAVGNLSAGLNDRELLRRFATGDQDAFVTLYRRHAGMVPGVCRRALPCEQDAEDACQATFLVLSRKAGSGRWQSSVANWLYLRHLPCDRSTACSEFESLSSNVRDFTEKTVAQQMLPTIYSTAIDSRKKPPLSQQCHQKMPRNVGD